MKLKTAILLVKSLNAVFIIALLTGLVLAVANAGDMKLLVLEGLVAVPAAIAFLFRMSLINLYLRKCKYPVVFLHVLNKLRLMSGLEITWSGDAETDIDRPTYSTEQFLADNDLVADIGSRQPGDFTTTVLFTFFIISGILSGYFRKQLSLQEKVIAGVVLCILLVLLIVKKITYKKPCNYSRPLIKFTREGLIVKDHPVYYWNTVFDWAYGGGEGDTINKIIIYYYNLEKETKESVISLKGIDADPVDVLMLLAHFRAKYH